MPAGGSTADYEAYRRELALTASVDAVREVLRGAGIDAAVSLQDGVCVITPVDIRDKAAIESLLPSTRARCLGSLRGIPMTAQEKLAPLAASCTRLAERKAR